MPGPTKSRHYLARHGVGPDVMVGMLRGAQPGDGGGGLGDSQGRRRLRAAGP